MTCNRGSVFYVDGYSEVVLLNKLLLQISLGLEVLLGVGLITVRQVGQIFVFSGKRTHKQVLLGLCQGRLLTRRTLLANDVPHSLDPGVRVLNALR